jgi:hypothetical protein
MTPIGCFYDDYNSLSPPGSHPTSPRRGSSVKSLRQDALAQQQQQQQQQNFKKTSPRNAIEEAALTIRKTSTVLSSSSSNKSRSLPNSPRKGASQTSSPRSMGGSLGSPRPTPAMVVVQTVMPAGPTPSTNPSAGRQQPLTIPTTISYSARPAVPTIIKNYDVMDGYPPRDGMTSPTSTVTSYSDADMLDDSWLSLSPRSKRKKKWNAVEEAKAQKGCAIRFKRLYVT